MLFFQHQRCTIFVAEYPSFFNRSIGAVFYGLKYLSRSSDSLGYEEGWKPPRPSETPPYEGGEHEVVYPSDTLEAQTCGSPVIRSKELYLLLALLLLKEEYPKGEVVTKTSPLWGFVNFYQVYRYIVFITTHV